MFATNKTKTKAIQKDQTVSEWNHGWKKEQEKCNIFRTSVNWQIPTLPSNECYIILFSIHIF